jgi:hypothetical protein
MKEIQHHLHSKDGVHFENPKQPRYSPFCLVLGLPPIPLTYPTFLRRWASFILNKKLKWRKILPETTASTTPVFMDKWMMFHVR